MININSKQSFPENSRELISTNLMKPGLLLKPNKDSTKEENYKPITHMNIDGKILNKIVANQIQKYIKSIIYPNLVGFVLQS